MGGFLLNSLSPFIDTLMSVPLQSRVIQLNVVTGYLLYPVIGYLISHYDIRRLYRYIIYVMGLLGLMLHICGTYLLSISGGQIIQIFKEYNNVGNLLYSLSIFLFVKNMGPFVLARFHDFARIVPNISSYTFSIYLLHWYIMRILLHFSGISSMSITWRVGSPTIIVGSCIAIIWCFRKIPILKKLFP